MRFKFNPEHNTTNEFDAFVGKDLWVRVRSKYDACDYYIRLDKYTEDGIKYKQISTSLVDSGFGWYDDRDFGWDCYQDFDDFSWDFRIVQPLDVYTTDELIEMNNAGI